MLTTQPARWLKRAVGSTTIATIKETREPILTFPVTNIEYFSGHRSPTVNTPFITPQGVIQSKLEIFT